MTTFQDLGLAAPLLRALTAEGYENPTPIQQQAIPPLLLGKDVQGIAQTGTGKTAAFSLPMLHRMLADPRPRQPRACRALILAPTRELAAQIEENIRAYARHTGLRTALMFGGVPKGRQARAVQNGVDILVACPGRLLDHMADRAVRLDQVEMLVLDEADHMMDLGFIVPIRRIVAQVPAQRQTMFFSATMPKEIAQLAGAMLRDPVHVQVSPVSTTAELVEQRVVFIGQEQKRHLLTDLLRENDMERTLVFTRTKHGADKVARHLEAAGQPVAAIHGNKSQSQRERALSAFREGRIRVLVATDVAARGIDVDGVTHVVNFELPNVPESYVHRIGRTARAGRSGMAISFCDPAEKPHLRGIEKLIRTRIAALAPGALAA